jgi:hypothetical protein
MKKNDARVGAMNAKELARRFGAREAHRILADRLCWERLTARGITPTYTPRPAGF